MMCSVSFRCRRWRRTAETLRITGPSTDYGKAPHHSHPASRSESSLRLVLRVTLVVFVRSLASGPNPYLQYLCCL